MIIASELYAQIVRAMPIPCVDLLICDPLCRVLLLKRKNEPARGQWWFPGGRVHFGEPRLQAAERKLREECGLHAVHIVELNTHDLILQTENDGLSHAITTVMKIQVAESSVTMDAQSDEARWLTAEEWRRESLHPFVSNLLNLSAPLQTQSEAICGNSHH
jgi:colanic acid biosynthesis protein WcaH